MVREEPPDGLRFGANEILAIAEPFEKRIQFLFAEIRMLKANALNFPDDVRMPRAFSFVLWHPLLFV